MMFPHIQRSPPSMNLGVKLDQCILIVQTAVKMLSLQNLSEPTEQFSFDKKMQRLAVTYPKNKRMDPHGAILSIIFKQISFAISVFGQRYQINAHPYLQLSIEKN